MRVLQVCPVDVEPSGDSLAYLLTRGQNFSVKSREHIWPEDKIGKLPY